MKKQKQKQNVKNIVFDQHFLNFKWMHSSEVQLEEYNFFIINFITWIEKTKCNVFEKSCLGLGVKIIIFVHLFLKINKALCLLNSELFGIS